MKSLILAASLTCFAFASTTSYANNSTTLVVKADVWEKSTSGTFIGLDMNTYKVNPKDASLWKSTDGKNFTKVENGQWQEKSGKWVRITGGKVMWSADQGQNWRGLPDWSWQGGDGTWYKLDASWNLLVKKVK